MLKFLESLFLGAKRVENGSLSDFVTPRDDVLVSFAIPPGNISAHPPALDGIPHPDQFEDFLKFVVAYLVNKFLTFVYFEGIEANLEDVALLFLNEQISPLFQHVIS